MDVSGEVYIWVTKVEILDGHAIMDGCSFDCQLGFGAEGVRQFQGRLAVVSPSKVEVIEAELGMAHFSRRGLFWVSDPEISAAPPFMITSNLF